MTNPMTNAMSDLTRQMFEFALVPVVTLLDASRAVGLGEALAEGGLPVAEITLRSAAGIDGIRKIAKNCPDVLVGAGTVLSVDQAKASADAGARFVVTPGFAEPVVAWCLKNDMPVYPGVSGTEGIEMARAHGLTVVKFFPAEQAGGIPMLKALSAPYQSIRFMPTGGIGPGNVNDYLALPCVVACGGSWLAAKGAIASGDFASITATVRASLRQVYGCAIGPDGVEIGVTSLERTRAYLERNGAAVTSDDGSVSIGSTGVTFRP